MESTEPTWSTLLACGRPLSTLPWNILAGESSGELEDRPGYEAFQSCAAWTSPAHMPEYHHRADLEQAYCDHYSRLRTNTAHPATPDKSEIDSYANF